MAFWFAVERQRRFPARQALTGFRPANPFAVLKDIFHAAHELSKCQRLSGRYSCGEANIGM